MIGVVIVSHSNISKGRLLEHIVGKQENIVAISILPEMMLNLKGRRLSKQ